MDASYGEVNLNDNLTDKQFYPFMFLNEAEGTDTGKYCYGEITVPGNFGNRHNGGIHVHIPYIPEYRQLKLRFLLDKGNGESSYMINRMDNGIWFTVFNSDMGTLYLSAFRRITSTWSCMKAACCFIARMKLISLSNLLWNRPRYSFSKLRQETSINILPLV